MGLDGTTSVYALLGTRRQLAPLHGGRFLHLGAVTTHAGVYSLAKSLTVSIIIDVEVYMQSYM